MYAIVCNCHYNGLSIIQELGRRGVDVRAFDSSRSIGTWSKYASYAACPNPESDEKEFISYLLEYGSRQGKRGIIFPTNDSWVSALSRHRGSLKAFFEIIAPSHEAVEILLDKSKFFQWAQRHAYNVPQTWQLASDQPIPIDSFPLVIKPECRRKSSNDPASINLQRYLDRNRLEVVNSFGEFEALLEKHGTYRSNFIAQQYIRGLSDSMYTVGIYADRLSRVRGIFTGRKVRGFPPDCGDCVVGQIESVPPTLLEEVIDIVTKLEYTGIAEFEFKRDDETRQFYLIEINPRSWSWIGITPACGVSLPWIAFQDMSNQVIPQLTTNRQADGSVKYVKILQDFSNCMWRNKQAGYRSWSLSFSTWRNSLIADKIIIAEFQSDDILPAFIAATLYLRGLTIEALRWISGRLKDVMR